MDSERRNVRGWSDEDLKMAVATMYTWRAVAEQLGLAPGSTNSVRRHAKRLGLDTSHFRQGSRTWCDDDLRAAVAISSTWTEVMRALELAETGAGRSYVIARARGLGLDVKNDDASSRQPIEVRELRVAEPNLGRLGSAAERIAIAWFALRGIPVSVPTGQQVYDLLVTLAEGVQRVQVKSGTYRATAGTWRVGVGRRPYVQNKTAQRIPYDPDELDYYFIIDGDAVLYLVPSAVLGGRTQINIGAYDAYRVGDASSLLARTA